MREFAFSILLDHNFSQFSFQLLVSEAAFLIGVPRKKRVALRLPAALVICFGLAWCWDELISPFGNDAFLLPYVFVYIGYAIISGLAIGIAFDVRPMEVIFIVAGGYAAEHMCFAVARMGLHIMGFSYGYRDSLLIVLVSRYLIYIAASVIVYYIIVRGNKARGFGNADIRIAILALVLLFSAITLSVYWSYDPELAGSDVAELICPAYSFLCCAFVLLTEYRVLLENSLKREKEMMEHMLLLSDAQQKSAKEAIDIINIKCHDLKHQIRALAHVEDSEIRLGYLQEIAGAISIYDATYHTGCKALDYVLREKTLLFNEYHVEFSCMADGKEIAFMASADIYALLGNALDNALEALMKEKEEERFISLHITKRGDIVLFHMENRCSREITFSDGLPLTDKEDKTQHGFGVRSIRYVAEKYNGEAFMKTEGGTYCLDILFPRG